MLLEMLTGSKPFAGLKYSQLMEAKNTVLERLPGMLPLETFPLSERLIRLLRKMIHPDPTQRFSSAEEAELSDDGAAGFLKELVLSERSQEYASELRQWIAEMEIDATGLRNAASPHPHGTTRIIRQPGATRIIDPAEELDASDADFDLSV
ncbi:MAG: hypothetical protein R3C49_08170 [Planctomycetaceae bacterium]